MHSQQSKTVEPDGWYFARRCLEELCSADQAACRAASSIHYELAGRYAALAGVGPIVPRPYRGPADETAHPDARAAYARNSDQPDYSHISTSTI